jgi:hypothetical protein
MLDTIFKFAGCWEKQNLTTEQKRSMCFLQIHAAMVLEHGTIYII